MKGIPTGDAAGVWCVDSFGPSAATFLTPKPYRTRRFKHLWAARAFMILREIFYLMPHPFPTYAVLGRGD